MRTSIKISIRLALVCLLACAPIYAYQGAMFFSSNAINSVSFDGLCEAGTTSCTLAKTKAGSLKIVIAIVAGSVTPATLPSGWTQIATVATPNSGTKASMIVGCNVSSSSSDTGTGIWTNATEIIGLSYSGTGAVNTANCNTTGIGNGATAEAQTSTTISWTGFAPNVTSGSSWIVLGAYSNLTLAACQPPSGTTTRTAAGSNKEIASDTNGGVKSWAGATCSITSSSWLTWAGEVL